MRTLSPSEWNKYKNILVRLSETAADEFRDAVWKASGYFGGVGLGNIPANDLIKYAYALVTKYGEVSATVAAEMYDEIAALSGVAVPLAIPAETASYSEVAKTVNGVLDVSQNEKMLGGAVGRLVKQAAADTTLQNAKRDGAEAAWVTVGDTCAFCVALASQGWQRVSSKTMRDGHAEHIHANCDCEYVVRFDSSGGVAGYNPSRYQKMYYGADGNTPKERINAMRREMYAKNKDEINAQKREAYALREEVKEDDEYSS